jgi:methionyl-tRNA formyltransferase
MSSKLHLVFMGTPELARVLLEGISMEPWVQLDAVVSQPDRPAGRHLQPMPSAVSAAALARGLSLLRPDRARDPGFISQIQDLKPDLILVAAYGQLLPQALLEIPRLGCLNVHTSLLPRWRGAAPIQWAIASGDAETGVSLMRMDVGLDTGPVIAIRRTPIGDTETSASLHDRLARLGVDLVREEIPPYAAGLRTPVAQPSEGVTLAPKITREDGRLDWNRPAADLARRLRAFTPWPGAHCWIPAEPKPRLLKVHAARVAPMPTQAEPGTVIARESDGLVVACGSDALVLIEVQSEGGRRMAVRDFLAGNPVQRFA